jgi:pimeloyl-ACP methyl ester carboxylesterase
MTRNPSVSTATTTDVSIAQARGGSLAYRWLGNRASKAPPLLLTQRFRGTMDHWDPLFLDELSADRQVIVFDNYGVARSGGSPAKSVAEQARGAIDLMDALQLKQVDVLGWSMGGTVAQVMALDFPERVRRIVVAGSSPGGVTDAPVAAAKIWEVAGKPVNVDEDFLYLFFHDSESSRQSGREHLQRLKDGYTPFSPPVSQEAVMAQVGAIRAWSTGADAVLPRLGQLRQPVLVANGQFDRMAHPYNSYVLGQKAPQAKLVLYPDSGHGFLFQHHKEFTEEVARFLA